MVKQVSLGLTWLSVAATIVGFCLPWASLELHAPGVLSQLKSTVEKHGLLGKLAEGLGTVTATVRKGSKMVTGKLPLLGDIPDRVSGIQIPRIANQENAQVALALFEMVTGSSQHIGLKSYAVYLLPGIALLCGVLLSVLGGRPQVTIGIAVTCAVIAGIGFWKLLTITTTALLVTVTIQQGLWLSLCGYVGLALAAILRLVSPKTT